MVVTYVNGELLPEHDAVVSAFDHGLVVGDGVFETICLTAGRPFALTRHLDRLERSATGLGIGPVDARQIRDAIEQVVASAEFSEGRIRVTVTAGLGPLGSGRHDGPQSVIVAASPLEHAPDGHPAAVTVVPWRRNEHGALTGLKTTSYGENARALAYATERGAEEAIFANTAGNLCEGSGTNVFYVVGDDLVTPTLASGCLAGITRGLVIELCPTVERDAHFEHFIPGVITEAFITSAIRGVQPIFAIDGERFADAPGPRTREAMERYAALRSRTSDP